MQNMQPLSFTVEEIDLAIPFRFAKVVEHFAEQPAIQFHSQMVTYAELDRTSSLLAATIQEHLGEKEEIVALFFSHSLEQIVTILAVLKAGKAYIALDPNHPAHKLSVQMGDQKAGQKPESAIRLLITDEKHLSEVKNFAPEGCLVLQYEEMRQPRQAVNLVPNPNANRPAAYYFSSGTTGQPKMVARKHNNILHRIWWETTEDALIPEDRVAMLFFAGYAASANDIFGALLSGSRLCLYDVRTQGILGLRNWLKQVAITRMHISVPFFRQLLSDLSQEDFFPTLRQVTPASQQIFKSDLESFWQHVSPECQVISRLASSETGIICRMTLTPETKLEGEIVPVGYPIPGKEVLILDALGNPLPNGQVGEIALRSRYLTSRQTITPETIEPEKIETSSNVKPTLHCTGDLGRLSEDGCLEFLGRIDDQVKIRGYTVVLSEVEAAIQRLPGVQNVVVIAHEAIPGEKQLIAYVAVGKQSLAISSELRSNLLELLPSYMIPAHFIFLDLLPLTNNGKLDRKLLPTLQHVRPSLANPFVAPHTPLEAELATVWSEILGIQPIGIHDKFLDLGGHSLSATRIVSQVQKRFGANIPLQTLFESSTISDMAVAIMVQKLQMEEPMSLNSLLTEIELSN